MNLTFDSPYYHSYIGSPSLKLTCLGSNLGISDIVWIKYLLSNPEDKKVIYTDGNYIDEELAKKYSVDTQPEKHNNLVSTLTLFNIQETDILNGYECVCNIYKRCTNSNQAKANTSIIKIKLITSLLFYVILKFYSKHNLFLLI